MSGPAEHLSLATIAAATELTPSAISNWRRRHRDFPAADTVSGQELFRTEEMLLWLGKHTIPANARKPGEGRGTTYRDRILRNLPGHRAAAGDWAPALWSAFDLLRIQHGPAESVRLLLGLLYVRTRESSLWHALTRQPDPAVVWHQLGAVTLRPGIGGRPVPVFPTEDQASGPGESLLVAIRTVDRIDLGPASGTGSATGEMCDALLARVVRDMGSKAGRYTPASLVRLMVALADPGPTDHVLDPYCGSGEFLAGVAAHADRAGGLRLHGQPPNDESWRTATLSSALHDLRPELSEPALGPNDDRFPGRRFDHVLLNPPFNQRHEAVPGGHWPFGEPPARNATFAWLQRAVTKLTANGRAVVLTANGATFSRTTSEARIRSAMVEAGVVECVVALPGHLFRSTAIPVTLWVLRGIGGTPPLGQVLFADTRTFGTMASRTERSLADDEIDRIASEYLTWREHRSAGSPTSPTFARAVSYADIRDHGYSLNPAEYVSTTPDREGTDEIVARVEATRRELTRLHTRAGEARSALERRLDTHGIGRLRATPAERRPARLGDVVELIVGPARLHKSDSPAGGTPVVTPRNIGLFRIRHDDLPVVSPGSAKDLARFRLLDGDVVGVRTGTLGRYGRVTGEEAGWFLGPGCFLLRPGPDVDPDYLTYYLNGPAARRWLRERVTSSAIEHVASATLHQMPLALPDMATQHDIVDVLRALDADAALHDRIRVADQGLRDLLVPIWMEPEAGPARPTG